MIQSRRSLTPVLQNADLIEHPDAALIQELCFGVIRWFYTLDSTLRRFIGKPLKKKDYDVYALLLIALYQLEITQKPAYAVVSESVKAAKALGKKWSSALINGVLRQYLRGGAGLSNKDEQASYAHPSWIINAVKNAWPQYWQKILAANNQRPRMYLRANRTKVSVNEYHKMLSEVALGSTFIDELPDALLLDKPVPVHRLPCFNSGLIAVQSLSAQIAVDLLLIEPNLKVLDACAAPGGKTCHILEREPSIDCLALDVDGARLEKINENLARLNLTAKTEEADFCQTEAWWNGDLFDRVLLDAPCSATGVIRRHPDIKLLKTSEDVSRLCLLQKEMLEHAWRVLKPEGYLLYATCSVLPEENDEQIKEFLQKHEDAISDPVKCPLGLNTDFGLQLLPGVGETQSLEFDGFYYARIKKAKTLVSPSH